MMQNLKIKFLSDWHISEGSGQPGHIDKLVRRHPIDNIPYVPAKTITGIWRDACEQLAHGLDNGSANGTWQKWVTLLFGDQPNERNTISPDISPQAATLTIRTARFPNALRKKIASSEKLKQALTFIKPSVRLDKNGQAIDNNLHFDEVVRAGAILEARVFLEEEVFRNKAQKQTAYALLWAAAQTVQRLGGKRRRGLGRCQFQFDAINKEEALKQLQQPAELPKAQALDFKDREFTQEKPSKLDAWIEIPLDLTLKSPIIIAQGEFGNVVTSRDYIPGTHLLAAVSKLLRGKNKLNLFDDVVRGDIQVSNAYLADSNSRGLPVPMALFYKKDDDSGKVYNRLMTNEAEAQLKQHRTGYLINDKNLVKTQLQLTTHGTIDDKYQRPNETVGGVFSFEAIPAGTCLQSVLKMRQPIAEKLKQAYGNNWWQVLNKEISIGKSKKDDYGWVKITPKPTQTNTNTTTIEDNKQELTLWLCSDLLMRNSRLRPSTDITDLQTELEKHLDVSLSPRNSNDEQLAVLVRTSRIDGWHQNWGQPHSSYLGLAAGSCIVFECIKGELDKNKLQALMQRGLGERRAEGFGEVRFNPSLLSKKTADLNLKQKLEIKDDFSADTEVQATSRIRNKHNPEDKFIYILEKAALREDIQQIAVKLSADKQQRQKLFGWDSDKPSNSQLGSLRAVLTRMRTETDKGIVQEWLKNLQATDNRKDKWKQEGLKFIQDIIDKPNFIWEQMGIVLNKEKLKTELWAEAVRTWFAIAIHYEQRDRE
jgi:CRISPR-associated protein Csx10